MRLEDFIPEDYPLRPIRAWINEALTKLDERFSAMRRLTFKEGRPSIAPEKLGRAMLLQVLYSVRGERQLVEQTNDNLLFRWFVGLAIEDAVNCDRPIEHDVVIALFNTTVDMAQAKGWRTRAPPNQPAREAAHGQQSLMALRNVPSGSFRSAAVFAAMAAFSEGLQPVDW